MKPFFIKTEGGNQHQMVSNGTRNCDFESSNLRNESLPLRWAQTHLHLRRSKDRKWPYQVFHNQHARLCIPAPIKQHEQGLPICVGTSPGRAYPFLSPWQHPTSWSSLDLRPYMSWALWPKALRQNSTLKNSTIASNLFVLFLLFFFILSSESLSNETPAFVTEFLEKNLYNTNLPSTLEAGGV